MLLKVCLAAEAVTGVADDADTAARIAMIDVVFRAEDR